LAVGCWLLDFGNSAVCQVQDSVRLQEVEVNAAKSGKNLTSAAPVHSLDQNDFTRLGVTDVSDVLRRLPGITLKDYGGAGGMKTVSVRGFGSQHTGVIYDGIALSDCQTGEIDLQRYTLNDIGEIDLAIGDGNDIFQPARNMGSAATLSIASPTLTQHKGEARMTVGAWGYLNPMARICHKLSEKVMIDGMLDYVYAENDYPFTLENVKQKTSQDRTNSRMNQWHGELNINAKGGKTRPWELKGKAYYYDNDRQLPGAVHYYVNDNDETLHERNAFGQMQWRTMICDRFSMKLSGKWNWASSDYHNGKPSGGITSNEYWQREGYGSAALLYVPTEKVSLDYSADYIFNSLNSTRQDIRPKRHSVLQALAAKYHDDRLTVIGRGLLGIYDDENDDVSRLSPSVSISYRVLKDKDLFVRASWKDMIRMPSFRELYYFHMGDTNLKPEKTRQWNVGVAYSLRTKKVETDCSVDIYINKVNDKIVTIPMNMFVVRSLNLAEVKAVGGDVSISGKYHLSVHHAVGLAGNYSYQQVENHTDSESKYYGNQIAYTPLHSGSLTAYWENPWANLSITGDGMSERWTTNEHSEGTRIAGFMEWSASAYRKIGNLTLRASITNILDKQYDIVARYPMPGRGWKVGVCWDF